MNISEGSEKKTDIFYQNYYYIISITEQGYIKKTKWK